MNLYLSAHCGSIKILINVRRVMEVMDSPKTLNVVASDKQMLGHMTWRDQVLHSIDLPKYFGLENIAAQRLIIVESGIENPSLKHLVFAVEGSESLLTLSEDNITDTADYSEELTPMFSGIYSPVDSADNLLILRFPAVWMSSAISTEVGHGH